MKDPGGQEAVDKRRISADAREVERHFLSSSFVNRGR